MGTGRVESGFVMYNDHVKRKFEICGDQKPVIYLSGPALLSRLSHGFFVSLRYLTYADYDVE